MKREELGDDSLRRSKRRRRSKIFAESCDSSSLHAFTKHVSAGDRVLIFSGAGLSVSSGLPAFVTQVRLMAV